LEEKGLNSSSKTLEGSKKMGKIQEKEEEK